MSQMRKIYVKPVDLELSSNMHIYFTLGNEDLCIPCLADILCSMYLCQ